jgi:hypothetical protein
VGTRGQMQLASMLRWVGLSTALLALAFALVLLAGAPGKGDAPGPPTGKTATGEEPAEEVSEEVTEDVSEEGTTKVSGEVATTTDPEGDTEYTLRTSEGRVFELSAGPPWFYEEGYPLEPFVGETVTVTGEVETNQNKITICHKGHVTITVDEHAWPAHRDRHHDTMGACSAQEAREEASEEDESKPEIEVFSVTTSDGQTTEIRSPGKPPWAGGPKVVGEKHPGFGKGEE